MEVVLEQWQPQTGLYLARSQYEAPEIDGVVKVRGGSSNRRLGTFVPVKIVKSYPYDLLAEFVAERGQKDDRSVATRVGNKF